MISEKVTTPELRNKVVAKAEKIYSDNSDMLIKALNIEDMDSTKNFFVYFSGGDVGSSGYKSDAWRWFAGVS
jgi:hypothetical protein